MNFIIRFTEIAKLHHKHATENHQGQIDVTFYK